MSSRLDRELEKLDPNIPFRAIPRHRHHTWAKTFHSRPELYIQPHTDAEIKKIVTLARRCRRRIVLTGSAHSPSDLTCTSSWMVNLDHHARVLKVDRERRTLLVQGGIRLHDLNLAAAKEGLTIPNLGSIDEQSVVGAISTSTHGSSLYHGLLSASVRSLKIVLANGNAVLCSATQNESLFRAALVSLGALGIVVEVEFEMVPSTNIHWHQTLVPLSDILSTWQTTLWSSAEFTRVWWLPYTARAIVWRAEKTDLPPKAPESNWYGGSIGFHTYHILLWISNYIPRILPYVERFIFGMQYGFKLYSTISAIEEQRTGLLMNCLYSQFVNEWAIPLSRGPEAIARLDAWISGADAEQADRIPFSVAGLYVHCPVEVRIADTTKTTPRPYLDFSCPTEPTLFLNATLYRPYHQDPPCMKRYYQAFEWLMKDMGGRPHWAKNFQTVDTVDVEEMYGEDLTAFRKVRESVDPDGMFAGEWHRRTILGSPAPSTPTYSPIGMVDNNDNRLPLEERVVKMSALVAGGTMWEGEVIPERGNALEFLDKEGKSRRLHSRRSSEESFDVLNEAEVEASTLLRGWEESGSEDDEGWGGSSGIGGREPFTKM